MSFDSNAYKTAFQRQNYDRIVALIPKGKGKEVKAYADSRGKSVSQVIVEALEAHCKLNLSRPDGG